MNAGTLRSFTTLLVFYMTFFTMATFSQPVPPAQGPPQPPIPGTPTITFGIYTILGQIKSNLQTVVENVNNLIADQTPTSGVEALLSYKSTTYKPAMAVTTLTNQPNQNVVRFSMMIEFEIKNIKYNGIPYFSRKINQTIQTDIACKNWFAPPGNLEITVKVDKPYLDNNSFAEQALNFFIGNTLTNMVDKTLRQILPNSFILTNPVANTPCSCLGVALGKSPYFTDADVTYAYKRNLLQGTTVQNTISVTMQSIKRLPARTQNGEILYAPAEDIQIELYSNSILKSTQVMQIKEGETRALSSTISIPRPGNTGSLLLIGNITQLQNFTKDTRFISYTAKAGFGVGQQKIVIQKTYTLPPSRLPGGGMSKPVQIKVDAYELTIQVGGSAPPNRMIQKERKSVIKS